MHQVTRRGSLHDGYALLELVVVIGVIGVLVGLLLCAIQKTRDAAARLNCQSNVKQIALALHQFHDSNSTLPPGHRSLFNRDLMPFSGWPVSVLPYVEQQSLADRARTVYRLVPRVRQRDYWFDYQLEHDPQFLQRIERARQSLRDGRGIKLENLPNPTRRRTEND